MNDELKKLVLPTLRYGAMISAGVVIILTVAKFLYPDITDIELDNLLTSYTLQSMVLGVLIGYITQAIMHILLAKSIMKLLDSSDSSQGNIKNMAILQFQGRFLLFILVSISVLLLPRVFYFTSYFLGIISVKLAIYLQKLVMKK